MITRLRPLDIYRMTGNELAGQLRSVSPDDLPQILKDLAALGVEDGLTHTLRYEPYRELLRGEVQHCTVGEIPIVVGYYDIDRFKEEVNDRYGHQVGDRVLAGVANTLISSTRSGYDRRSQIIPVDEDRRSDLVDRRSQSTSLDKVYAIGRVGGDEFNIVFPETTLSNGYRIAIRLKEAVKKTPYNTDKGPIRVTLSAGICEFDPKNNLVCYSGSLPVSEIVNLLIEGSDESLYRAKNAGRDRVRGSYIKNGEIVQK